MSVGEPPSQPSKASTEGWFELRATSYKLDPGPPSDRDKRLESNEIREGATNG